MLTLEEAGRETTSESTVLVLLKSNLAFGRDARFSGGGGGARDELFMVIDGMLMTVLYGLLFEKAKRRRPK